jgi:hypothetical protein
MTKPLLPLLVLAALAVGCGSDGAQEAGPVPGAPTASTSTPTETVEPTNSTTTEPAPTESGGTTTTTTTSPQPAPRTCPRHTGGEEGVYMNLTDVRVGAHAGYDRVVFEFEEPDPNPAGNGGIPYYQIKTARPPFTEDPSDLPIDVDGDAFARIIFQGASGYDFDGNATYDGPRRLTPGFGTLTDVVEGGDFEATMTWILGLSRTTCWEVQELADPVRLVIDFHNV